MAEREEDHRHRQEVNMQRSDAEIRRRGQWMAFIICLVVIVGGIWLVSEGHQLYGLVAILTPLATLVGLFLFTQRR